MAGSRANSSMVFFWIFALLPPEGYSLQHETEAARSGEKASLLPVRSAG